MVTLLNEVCLAAGGKTLGFANPLFYQNPGMFNNVTHGTNAVQGNTEGWAAIKGWDAATGLGTPNFARMVAMVQKACRKWALVLCQDGSLFWTCRTIKTAHPPCRPHTRLSQIIL